jgi:hypothetical protein
LSIPRSLPRPVVVEEVSQGVSPATVMGPVELGLATVMGPPVCQ